MSPRIGHAALDSGKRTAVKSMPMKQLNDSRCFIAEKTPEKCGKSPRFRAAKPVSKLRPKRSSLPPECSKKFKLPLSYAYVPCRIVPCCSAETNVPCLEEHSGNAAVTQGYDGTRSQPSAIGSDSGCVLSGGTSTDARSMMENVCMVYRKVKNIPAFYDWQNQCLNDENLLNGTNMILSMPTGAGKTLIAEVIMLRELIIRRKNCILIVPYVAIAQEKVRSLSLFEDTFSVCVEEYAASKGRLPPIKRRKGNSVYVATIEKANMLINSLIEMDRIDEIGVVVVDELHMIGENVRGAVIEQALVKFMCKGAGQIIGMSATLSNIDELAMFLGASVFSTSFRPVKLTEKVKIDTSLYFVQPDGRLEFEMNLGENKLKNRDPEGLVPLLRDIIPKQSVLIFCPTKQNCENVCKTISDLMPKNLRERRKSQRTAMVEALKEEQNDGKLCSLLQNSIVRGVAYHHGGLTADERKIVESAFQDGIISVICCTSTLAAGVNLPARLVIIKAPLVGKEPLRKAQYLQMIGRAGRAGYDDVGEAITIVHRGYEEIKFLEMINGPLPKCISSLNEPMIFPSFLLDLISLKVAVTLEELRSVMQQTLFEIQNKNSGELVKRTLEYLKTHELVNIDVDGKYSASVLGAAVHAASLPPLIAQRICSSLLENLNGGIVLSSHFHLIFIVIPFDICVDIDWNIFYDEYKSLPRCEQILLARLGLNDRQLVKCLLDRPALKEGEVPVRLYISFMLQRLWKQETFFDVAERFHVSRGWLQAILQATCSQASSITRFAEKVPSLWPLKNLLPDLVQHLRDCSQQELIPLLSLDGVKRGRAQQLYNAGFKTIGSIASADSSALISTVEHLSRRQASIIIKSAKVLLRDQLAEKVEELEQIGVNASELLAKFITG